MRGLVKIVLLLLFAGLWLPGTAKAQTVDLTAPNFRASSLAVNQSSSWGPIVLGSELRLTNKQPSQVSSVYTKRPVTITKFDTTFIACFYCDSQDESNCADGITFVIQNNDPHALGNGGGQLGYGGIGKSVAFKLDTAQNTEFTPPDPSDNSIGLYTNGEIPCGGTDVSVSGIDFRHHDPMSVTLSYDGKVLSFAMTDITSHVHVEHRYVINIPETIGSKTAYVGFTAACGSGCSEQDVLGWKYASPVLPVAPGSDAHASITAANAQVPTH